MHRWYVVDIFIYFLFFYLFCISIVISWCYIDIDAI